MEMEEIVITIVIIATIIIFFKKEDDLEEMDNESSDCHVCGDENVEVDGNMCEKCQTINNIKK